jgi:fatty-acyl-CoA synthase
VSAAPTLAVAYEADFVEIVAEIRNELADNVLLIEVGGSSVPILEGAIPLEQLITDSSEMQPAAVSSPDDLYVIFTGGTTGPPKAVMWRQADAFVSALNGPSPDLDENTTYLDAIERTVSETPRLVLPAPPFMHGGGQWVALAALLSGNTVVIQEVVDHLDCADIWSTVERERVTMMLVAGNAYGVPLTDDLVANSYDLSSLKIILTGSVAMTSDVKLALIDAIPHIRIIETMGATESGVHLRHVATGNTKRSAGFTASAETVVLNETKERHLEAGESGTGWLARTGRIPLGYLDDAERTLNTFPIINGVRYSVPGDRAQVLSSGEIEFLGRDSMSINSGGEKIFAEEVEAALAASPEVFDVVVSSRDHPRWGQEVVALVSLRPGFTVTSEELKERASSHIARYKVPKLIAFVDYVQRNAVGKPDYAWARDQASKM